jgi:hypothetical protein
LGVKILEDLLVTYGLDLMRLGFAPLRFLAELQHEIIKIDITSAQVQHAAIESLVPDAIAARERAIDLFGF